MGCFENPNMDIADSRIYPTKGPRAGSEEARLCTCTCCLLISNVGFGDEFKARCVNGGLTKRLFCVCFCRCRIYEIMATRRRIPGMITRPWRMIWTCSSESMEQELGPDARL